MEELLQKVVDELKEAATTKTVVGEQFQLGEFTCVPVIKLGFGFGGGGDSKGDSKHQPSAGMGVGAGIGISPVAFLVSRGDQISILNVEKDGAFSKLFDKLPDMLHDYLEHQPAKNK